MDTPNRDLGLPARRRGQSDHAELEIRLAVRDPGGAPRAPSKIVETFLHEVLHAIDTTYNAGKLDEETARRPAEGLFQVLVDNGLLNAGLCAGMRG